MAPHPCGYRSQPNSEQYRLIGRATQVVFVYRRRPAKFPGMSKRGVHCSNYSSLGSAFLSIAAASKRPAAVNRTQSSLPSTNRHATREETPSWAEESLAFATLTATLLAGQFRRTDPGHGSATPRRRRKVRNRTPHRSRTRIAARAVVACSHKFCRRGNLIRRRLSKLAKWAVD